MTLAELIEFDIAMYEACALQYRKPEYADFANELRVNLPEASAVPGFVVFDTRASLGLGRIGVA